MIFLAFFIVRGLIERAFEEFIVFNYAELARDLGTTRHVNRLSGELIKLELAKGAD